MLRSNVVQHTGTPWELKEEGTNIVRPVNHNLTVLGESIAVDDLLEFIDIKEVKNGESK